jgi:DNA-binding winged helix-turn-helix (wHTH) protein/tetratricopeptide (TPR) repeat protein
MVASAGGVVRVPVSLPGPRTVLRKSDSPITTSFNFGPFDLIPADRILSKEGRPLQLSHRAFDILLVLVDRAPHLITKTELMNLVWAESFVEEANLAVAISVLRKTLGDDAQVRKFIQTVPKVGYRFIAEVKKFDSSRERAPERNSNAVVTGNVVATPGEIIANEPGRFSNDSKAHNLLWEPTLMAGLLLAVALGIVIYKWSHHFDSNLSSIRSIAVLPFNSDATDRTHAYLGVGVENSIINQLTASDKLMVPTGNAVARLPNSLFSNEKAVGRELGADAVMSGTIEFKAHETKVTADLTRVSDGQKLWGKELTLSPQQTLDLADVLEEDIATRVSSSLLSALRGTNARASFDTVSPEARDLYFRGRYYWNRRTEESLAKSIECFQKAVAMDPNFALAYAGLADAYVLSASFSVEPGRLANSYTRSAALSAINLDSGLVEPHASLGMISFFSDWEGAAAEQEFQKALALKPSYATAHHWYALDLAAMGRLDQAGYEIRKASELDPASSMIGTNVGWILYLGRHYGEAELAFRKVLEIDPTFARAHTRLGITLLTEGKSREAVSELRQALAVSQDPYVKGVLAEALASAGDRQEANRIVAGLIKQSKNRYVQPFGIALAYLALGQRTKSLEWLQRAYEDHTTSMIWAKIDPELDPLRSDQQFQNMLKTMKF